MIGSAEQSLQWNSGSASHAIKLYIGCSSFYEQANNFKYLSKGGKENRALDHLVVLQKIRILIGASCYIGLRKTAPAKFLLPHQPCPLHLFILIDFPKGSLQPAALGVSSSYACHQAL